MEGDDAEGAEEQSRVLAAYGAPGTGGWSHSNANEGLESTGRGGHAVLTGLSEHVLLFQGGRGGCICTVCTAARPNKFSSQVNFLHDQVDFPSETHAASSSSSSTFNLLKSDRLPVLETGHVTPGYPLEGLVTCWQDFLLKRRVVLPYGCEMLSCHQTHV